MTHTYFIIPTNSADVIRARILFPVGSSDEPEGSFGLSHLLEHILYAQITRGFKARHKDYLSSLLLATTYYDSIQFDITVLAEDGDELVQLIDNLLTLDDAGLADLLETERSLVSKELMAEEQAENWKIDRDEGKWLYPAEFSHLIAGNSSDVNKISVIDIKNWHQQALNKNGLCVIVSQDIDLNSHGFKKRTSGPWRSDVGEFKLIGQPRKRVFKVSGDDDTVLQVHLMMQLGSPTAAAMAGIFEQYLECELSARYDDSGASYYYHVERYAVGSTAELTISIVLSDDAADNEESFVRQLIADTLAMSDQDFQIIRKHYLQLQRVLHADDGANWNILAETITTSGEVHQSSSKYIDFLGSITHAEFNTFLQDNVEGLLEPWVAVRRPADGLV